MKKPEAMGSKGLVKKGLLSRLLDFLRAPTGSDIGTSGSLQDVSSPQQDAKTRTRIDSPYVPANVSRNMYAELEIARSRRPEQYARGFN